VTLRFGGPKNVLIYKWLKMVTHKREFKKLVTGLGRGGFMAPAFLFRERARETIERVCTRECRRACERDREQAYGCVSVGARGCMCVCLSFSIYICTHTYNTYHRKRGERAFAHRERKREEKRDTDKEMC